MHRSLTQIRAASVRDPCRHTGHESEAAWRSVVPTSRGHAFESLAQWALSAMHSGQPQLIIIMAATGLRWPGRRLDVASTGTAGGVTGNATGQPRERVVSVGTLAKSAYAINVIMFWFIHACAHLPGMAADGAADFPNVRSPAVRSGYADDNTTRRYGTALEVAVFPPRAHRDLSPAPSHRSIVS